MKNTALFGLCLATCSLLAAQDQAGPASRMKFSEVALTDPSVEPFRSSGEYAVEYVANKFMFEINKGLSTKSPEEFIGTFHLKSMTLPKSEDGKPVITNVKLTSLQVRNPANAPDEADQSALDSIQSDLENGRRPPELLVQHVDNGSGHADEWRFYRPIATTPACLACHGDVDSMSAAVKEKLHELYPDDQATNYHARQWRGVIRISLAPPAPPKS